MVYIYDSLFDNAIQKQVQHLANILADRTNGRAIGTVLRLSSVVVCLSVCL